MAWNPRTNYSGIQYGGNKARYYWNNSINPNATPSLCMANCTTYAYGRVLEAGCPAPVSRIVDADHWHSYVANGWEAKPYGTVEIQPGDIIEWTGKDVNVVEAVINGEPYMSGSFYTDDYGTSRNNRNFTIMPRDLFGISEWMITNYEWRFFHYASLSTYRNWGIGTPAYVLVNPNHDPDPPIPPEPEDQSLIVALSGTIINRRKRKNVKIIL